MGTELYRFNLKLQCGRAGWGEYYLKGCLRHVWAIFVCVHTMSENNLERCLSDLLAFYPEWAFYCVPLCPAAQTTAI